MSEFQDAQREFQAQRKQASADAGLLEGGITIPDGGTIPPPGIAGEGIAAGLARTGGRLLESFTGRERRARLPEELQEAPEAIEAFQDPSRLQGVPTEVKLEAVRGLFAAIDPKAQIDIIRAIPEVREQDIQTNEDGVTSFRLGGEEIVINQPGLTAQDIGVAGVRTVAQTLIQAGLSALPRVRAGGVGVRMGADAIADFTTSILMDVVAEKSGSQQGIDLPRAGVEAVGGALFEGAFGGVQALRNKLRAERAGVSKQALERARPEIEQARRTEAFFGEDFLSPAQRSMDFEALTAGRELATTVEGNVPAKALFRNQNEIVQETFERELRDKFGTAEAAAEAGATTQLAMLGSRQRLVDAQKEAEAGLFRQSFREAEGAGTLIDITDIVAPSKEALAKEFRSPSGRINRSLTRAVDLIENEVAPAPGATSNLRALNGAKDEIGAMIEEAKATGNKKLDFQLSTLRARLVDKMKRASDTFREGSEKFAEAQVPIDAFDRGVGGDILRLKDTDQARGKIFKSLKNMRQARQLLSEIDPSGEAFDAIRREHIAFKTRKIFAPGEIDPELAVGMPSNIPGRLTTALFGDATEKRVLMESLPTQEMRDNFLMLEDGFRRAAAMRPGGSDTAQKLAAQERRLTKVAGAIRAFIKKPLDTAIEAGSPAALVRRNEALAEVAFNPRFAADVTKVRRLSTKPNQQARALIQLLNRVLVQISEEPAEQTPPPGGGSFIR